MSESMTKKKECKAVWENIYGRKLKCDRLGKHETHSAYDGEGTDVEWDDGDM